jgi:hypothetical protein
MDRTAIITDYVTDMAAVETHILEAVERQVANEDTQRYPEAFHALSDLATVLRRHVEALEAYNARAEDGGLKEAVKEAVTGALGVAAGLYNQIRQEDAVSRSVRDTYTALGLANVSYHMLYTTALALKEPRLAALALKHLKELAPYTVTLSKVVCLVVARELAHEDKALDAGVGQEAARATHEAWQQAGDGASTPAAASAPAATPSAPSAASTATTPASTGATMGAGSTTGAGTPGGTPSGTGGQGF